MSNSLPNPSTSIGQEIKQQLFGYVKGRVVVACIVAAATYLVLRILKLPESLALALCVGVFDLVPIVGPAAALVVVMLVALIALGLNTAIIAGLALLLIQLVENWILEPVIIGKTTNLNPIVVFISVVFAVSIGGPIGAVLIVPLLIILKVVLTSLFPKS